MNREISNNELNELVDSFLALPSFNLPGNRTQLISLLPDKIRHGINLASVGTARQEVTALLRRCLDFEGGLECLLEIVRSEDAGTYQLAWLLARLRQGRYLLVLLLLLGKLGIVWARPKFLTTSE